jgi:hypothetical protein
VAGAEQRDEPEEAIAERTEESQVGASAAGEVPGALGEVGTGPERDNEARDLLRACRAVGVERDDDLPDCGVDAAHEGVALALAVLAQEQGVWRVRACRLEHAVRRAAVDEDHLGVP